MSVRSSLKVWKNNMYMSACSSHGVCCVYVGLASISIVHTILERYVALRVEWHWPRVFLVVWRVINLLCCILDICICSLIYAWAHVRSWWKQYFKSNNMMLASNWRTLSANAESGVEDSLSQLWCHWIGIHNTVCTVFDETRSFDFSKMTEIEMRRIWLV